VAAIDLDFALLTALDLDFALVALRGSNRSVF